MWHIKFLNFESNLLIRFNLWNPPGFNWAHSQQTRSTERSCCLLSDKRVLSVSKQMLSLSIPITFSVQRLHATVRHICRDSLTDSGVQHHQNCKWRVWLFKWVTVTTSEILKLPLCFRKDCRHVLFLLCLRWIKSRISSSLADEAHEFKGDSDSVWSLFLQKARYRRRPRQNRCRRMSRSQGLA